MKTAAQWRQENPELVSVELISEIQRDAREGMVDAHDIIMMTATLEDFVRQFPVELAALRAKHPNLFTK